MRRMHFTHGQTAAMVSTTGVQVLAINIVTHTNGTGRHLPVCTGQPRVVAAAECLVVLQLNLLLRIGHVGLALVGNYLGRQQVVVVEGATHKDGIAIGVVASGNSVLRDDAVAVMQPSVSCEGSIARLVISGSGELRGLWVPALLTETVHCLWLSSYNYKPVALWRFNAEVLARPIDNQLTSLLYISVDCRAITQRL